MAKLTPKKEDPAAAAEDKPKGGRKKLLIVAAVAVVALLGGGGTLLLLAKNSGEGHDQSASHAPKAPVFINLEPFTVNLQPENGEHYLQVVVTLKVSEKSVEENTKLYMPELRHKILLLLSGKKASEISTPDGREQLSDEIRQQVNAILYTAVGKQPRSAAVAQPIGKVSAKVAPDTRRASGSDPVQGVLFTSFIVQ